VRQALAQGEYSYVYCYTVNEEFANRYGELFEQPDGITAKTLYRVETDGESVKLYSVR